MMLGDWAVALILVILSIIVLLTGVIFCRLCGIWRVTSCLATGEEKQTLTNHEQRNGYMVTSGSDFNLDTSGKYVQYDTLNTDPAYVNLEAASPPAAPRNDDRTSPVSVDSASVASEYEVGRGLARAMSCESVASDTSIMELEPEMAKIGQLEFGLEYDREVSELVVSVIQARDLEANEVTGTTDSYVKLWLSPHTEGKMQTKVQKSTTHPIYKERFLFNVEPDIVDRKTVNFQVFASDKYARNKLLGETEIRLGDVSLNHPMRIWMNLRDLDQRPTELGGLMFSLSYLPTAERLTIVIVKARHLKWTYGRESGDAFVKVYLIQNGKKVGKKKTTTKKDEKSPIFNEAMIFNVPSSSLQNVQLRVTVAEQLTPEKTHSIGHVIVGSQVSGTELTHWSQMMTSLRRPVAMWHNLRK